MGPEESTCSTSSLAYKAAFDESLLRGFPNRGIGELENYDV
jgi:hypothetical protein